MAQDLELIKQGEEKIGGKLNQYSLEDKEKRLNYFTVDQEWNVIEIGLVYIKNTAAFLPIILKFQHLKYLGLWNAELEDITSLKELQGLMKLGLGGNQIRDISSLKELQGLKFVYLWNNQISDITSLLELKQLKILDLSNNKITHLPAEVLDLGLEIKWERMSGDDTGLF